MNFAPFVMARTIIAARSSFLGFLDARFSTKLVSLIRFLFLVLFFLTVKLEFIL